MQSWTITTKNVRFYLLPDNTYRSKADKITHAKINLLLSVTGSSLLKCQWWQHKALTEMQHVLHWKGFSGGFPISWHAVLAFFCDLQASHECTPRSFHYFYPSCQKMSDILRRSFCFLMLDNTCWELLFVSWSLSYRSDHDNMSVTFPMYKPKWRNI